MAKKPPRPGDFENDFDVPAYLPPEDVEILEGCVDTFIVRSPSWRDAPPPSLGARFSFRDWDWMIRTLGPRS